MRRSVTFDRSILLCPWRRLPALLQAVRHKNKLTERAAAGRQAIANMLTQQCESYGYREGKPQMHECRERAFATVAQLAQA
jgi:hypothetical protein